MSFVGAKPINIRKKGGFYNTTKIVIVPLPT